MLIFAIDDEPTKLRDTVQAICEAAPEAELMSFSSVTDALKTIRVGKHSPDIVFSEIEMPDVSGLEFAVKLKTLSPDTRVVFVTDLPQYALDAFRVRVQGYILKPLTAELVRTELDELPVRRDKLRVQCFGDFEVFWQGEPLKFKRRQTKELLAFLVDRRGAACTAEDVILAFWGEDVDVKKAKHKVRNFIADLRDTLKKIGKEDVLIRQGRQISIRPETLDCDYYRMLEGDMTYINAFRGQYMINYSWSELTAGRLFYTYSLE